MLKLIWAPIEHLLMPVMLPCAGLLQAEVPCSSHRLVALILMESYVRYYRCT